MARDNVHSRVVTWLKVLLPLAALSILSTIFFFSSGLNPGLGIPFADVDVEELAREQRITGPAYAGVTKDGTAVFLAAERAVPEAGDPGRAHLTNLSAELQTGEGVTYSAVASQGMIDTGERTIELHNGLRLTSSQGFTMTGERLQGSLDDTRIHVIGPIEAEAPFGTLTAGEMEITRADTGAETQDDNYHMVFRDRVRIVYNPPARGQP